LLIVPSPITARISIFSWAKEELRKRDFVPIVFNFERPEKSDFTETVRTLAGLCRFIIADITSPRSTPLELQATVPEYMITFIPIIEDGEESGRVERQGCCGTPREESPWRMR
jgi:hypothetical protein